MDKKNVFKPMKYKVYKSVLPYLLTLLLNKECKLYSVHNLHIFFVVKLEHRKIERLNLKNGKNSL